MTADEHRMYEAICSSHEPYGKDLFKNLFEVDDDGIIIYLFPPQNKFAIDVIVFLLMLMMHQHLRRIYKEHDEALQDLKEVVETAKKSNKKVESLQKELDELKKELTKLKPSS